jgi:hypothetical protein
MASLPPHPGSCTCRLHPRTLLLSNLVFTGDASFPYFEKGDLAPIVLIKPKCTLRGTQQSFTCTPAGLTVPGTARRGRTGRAAALPGHPVPVPPDARRLRRRRHLRRPPAQRTAGPGGAPEGA